mgnify:FL=1|jgi:hypothetical protein|nr:MAG TPA: hypothetical protein [Caudoviricetes sp.]
MPKESTNLKLKLYNAVADSAVLAKEWFNNIFDYTNSNWTKIDNAYKELLDLINNKVYSWNEITNKPDSIKNPNALTIQGNGTELANYDGGEAKTVNITKDVIGLNNVDNTSDVNKKIKWDNILNKPSFISSSILPYTVEYDSFYVGNGASVYATPLQIPVSKQYDAIGIIYLNTTYNGKQTASKNRILYELITNESSYSSFSGTFLPVAGIPNVFTTCSDLVAEFGENVVEGKRDSDTALIRKTDSGLEFKTSLNNDAWRNALNKKDYTYYIFGLNLTIQL